MKILVSGVAGFLGSHLAEFMLSKGHSIVGLDDFSTGSNKNLAKLYEHSNFQLIKHDIRDPIFLDVDVILNFACPASPVHYQNDPVRTLETNVLGMLNMLKLAQKSSAIIIQSSTSEVYGDPKESPQTESYWGNVNPIGIRSCYDEGKRAAETLCFDYHRQYGVDARVVRIFNTYGPNMSLNDGRVVSNFIVQALRNENISIYGQGNQTRSFCFVSDLIEAIYRVMTMRDNITMPINLGNPNEITVFELAQKIIKMTNSNSKIEYKSIPKDDPTNRKPDIALAKNILNWEPLISLENGLAQTINYFKELV
jgi:UDP-glucuronate decarboxylase